MKLTYEAILNDPRLLDRVLAEARHERSLAVHRLIVAPIVSLFKRPQPKVHPPLRNPVCG